MGAASDKFAGLCCRSEASGHGAPSWQISNAQAASSCCSLFPSYVWSLVSFCVLRDNRCVNKPLFESATTVLLCFDVVQWADQWQALHGLTATWSQRATVGCFGVWGSEHHPVVGLEYPSRISTPCLLFLSRNISLCAFRPQNTAWKRADFERCTKRASRLVFPESCSQEDFGIVYLAFWWRSISASFRGSWGRFCE